MTLERTRNPVHPSAFEAELRTLAHTPTLALSQVVALIQGFSHRGKAGSAIQYLSNYAGDVRVLCDAIRSCVITVPISPKALVKFCSKSGVRLPAEFVDEVLQSIPRSSKPLRPVISTDEYVRPDPKRGRPRKFMEVLPTTTDIDNPEQAQSSKKSNCSTRVQGREADIQRQAHDIIIAYIKAQGKVPRGKAVGVELSRKTDRSLSDVMRRFSMKTSITPDERKSAKRYYYLNRSVKAAKCK